MYSEIKEVVNYIGRYIYGFQPRRPTGIFLAELGNFLVIHVASCNWDETDPKNGEKDRVLNMRSGDVTAKMVQTAATEAGLNYEEVVSRIPSHLKIYINPGEVYMKVNDQGAEVPIWKGSVHADEEYHPIPDYIARSAVKQAEKNSNLGAAGQPLLIGRQPLPTNDKTVLELVNGCYVPLALEEYDESNSNLLPLQQIYRYRFVYKPHSSQTFTAVEFSQTRFGSSKARPDLQTMLNIKQMAASASHAQQQHQQPTSSIESNIDGSSSRSPSPHQLDHHHFYSQFY